MTDVANDSGAKPATAARIYDYQLGGTHNFPADRAAAMAMNAMFPQLPAMSRTYRAWLGRAVRYLADQGMNQFLDIGSGIPTQGNVHEIAQSIVPDAHVVYVDIDPVAVAEGLEMLDQNPTATSVWGDLRYPRQILDNPEVRALIDFNQPLALILAAVLHFVPDDVAYDAVSTLAAVLPPGSFLAISHGNIEDIEADLDADDLAKGKDVYRQRTTTSINVRTNAQIMRFFGGHELVEPGLVYVPLWRPEPGQPSDFDDNPAACGSVGGIARIA